MSDKPPVMIVEVTSPELFWKEIERIERMATIAMRYIASLPETVPEKAEASEILRELYKIDPNEIEACKEAGGEYWNVTAHGHVLSIDGQWLPLPTENAGRFYESTARMIAKGLRTEGRART